MKKILRSSRVSPPSPSPSASGELNTSIEEIQTCRPSHCITDRKKDRFNCTECMRSVHYSCTELPAYYIQLIKDKKKGIKFICINCVEMSKNIANKYPSTSQQVKSLKRDVTNCENIIKVKAEKEKEILKKCEASKTEADSKKKELAELKKKMDKNPALHTLEYVEQKMDANMEKFKEDVETLIKTELKSILNKSYADATKISGTSESKQTTMKEAIREAWREEDAEENDKFKRSPNIIVHGLTEQETNDDLKWAKDLVRDTHSRVEIKRVTRLGSPSQEKKRPLLVCLSNEREKSTLFGNLCLLKGIEKYRAVSITEDLTPDERNQLKKLSNQAKERNANNNSENEKWRVRGNSKNGFFLIKIKTKPQIENATKKVVFKNLTQTQKTKEQ